MTTATQPTAQSTTQRGTPAAHTWTPAWLHAVQQTEDLLKRRICGARAKSGQPCIMPPNSQNGRCRFHGGVPNIGAPAENQNALAHGLYQRRLLTCSDKCPLWDSCPFADYDVLDLDPKDRPACAYEQQEYDLLVDQFTKELGISTVAWASSPCASEPNDPTVAWASSPCASEPNDSTATQNPGLCAQTSEQRDFCPSDVPTNDSPTLPHWIHTLILTQVLMGRAAHQLSDSTLTESPASHRRQSVRPEGVEGRTSEPTPAPTRPSTALNVYLRLAREHRILLGQYLRHQQHAADSQRRTSSVPSVPVVPLVPSTDQQHPLTLSNERFYRDELNALVTKCAVPAAQLHPQKDKHEARHIINNLENEIANELLAMLETGSWRTFDPFAPVDTPGLDDYPQIDAAQSAPESATVAWASSPCASAPIATNVGQPPSAADPDANTPRPVSPDGLPQPVRPDGLPQPVRPEGVEGRTSQPNVTALSYTRVAKHIRANRLADAKELLIDYIQEYPDTPDKSEQGLASVAEEIAAHIVPYRADAIYAAFFDIPTILRAAT